MKMNFVRKVIAVTLAMQCAFAACTAAESPFQSAEIAFGCTSPQFQTTGTCGWNPTDDAPMAQYCTPDGSHVISYNYDNESCGMYGVISVAQQSINCNGTAAVAGSCINASSGPFPVSPFPPSSTWPMLLQCLPNGSPCTYQPDSCTQTAYRPAFCSVVDFGEGPNGEASAYYCTADGQFSGLLYSDTKADCQAGNYSFAILTNTSLCTPAVYTYAATASCPSPNPNPMPAVSNAAFALYSGTDSMCASDTLQYLVVTQPGVLVTNIFSTYNYYYSCVQSSQLGSLIVAPNGGTGANYTITQKLGDCITDPVTKLTTIMYCDYGEEERTMESSIAWA